MRRLIAAFGIWLSASCLGPAWAHGDADELGHHWDIAKYRGEMWFQTLVMFATMGLYVVGIFVARAWRRRRSLQ